MEDLSMEERIRVRAYELWEKDGSHAGRDDEYWNKARELVENEASAASSASAAPMSPKASSKGGKR